MITVKISNTLTEAQREDPRFKIALQHATFFFNSPVHFTKEFRSLLCLHEAGHIVYARRAGATDIRFHGPMMRFCDGCPDPVCTSNPFGVSKSSVSWTFPPNCDVIAAIKADTASFIFREVLTDTKNDEAAIFSDMQTARKDYEKHRGEGEKDFLCCVETARQEILKDLGSPEFVKLAWDTADEFRREVFPIQKVTAASLRAKRLGWLQV
jgi:hypothetical protein